MCVCVSVCLFDLNIPYLFYKLNIYVYIYIYIYISFYIDSLAWILVRDHWFHAVLL